MREDNGREKEREREIDRRTCSSWDDTTKGKRGLL